MGTDPAGAFDGLLEMLASIEHDRWCHWQKHVHGVSIRGPDGSLTIPAELVSRWEQQMRTPYAQLSEREKESDRVQVRKYLPLIVDAIGERRDEQSTRGAE